MAGMQSGPRRAGAPGIALGAAAWLVAAAALAGADEGSWAGFRLGEAFAGEAAASPQPDGTVRLEVAARDGSGATVRLYASPGTRTLGKIVRVSSYPDLAAAAAAADAEAAALAADYADWASLLAEPVPLGRDGGAMLARRERGAFALIVFFRPEDGRFVVHTELEYAAGSAEKKAFRARVREERGG